MVSLFDELSEKIRSDPRLTKHGGARQDLGILLFSQREAVGELWKAAERFVSGFCPDDQKESVAELRAAVEKLRPLFGER